MNSYSDIRFILLTTFALTSLIQAQAQAQSWISVFQGTGYMGEQESRFIDSSSIRAYDRYIFYSFRTHTGRVVSVVERIALVDCRNATRFEVISESDVREKPFRSTYPGTSTGAEVAMACNFAAQSPPLPSIPPDFTPPLAPIAPAPAPAPPSRARSQASSGTGFAVQANFVVTNFHVVDSCEEVTIRQGQLVTKAHVAAESRNADLALLRTDSKIAVSAPVRRSATLGERVTVAGYPLAGILATDVIVTSGQVNSMAGLGNDPSMLQISAPVQPGNSGGPLVDRAGSVVGVVTSKINVERLARVTGDYAQNINFAIKPELLRLFLDSNQVTYKNADLGKPLDGAQVAELARRYTVQVTCVK